MPKEHYLTELQRDTIAEFFNIGMGQAAASLNEMLNSHIEMTIPDIEVLSIADAAQRLAPKKQPFTGIRLTFKGRFWGEAVLLFSCENSLRITQLIIQQQIPESEIAEFEQDTISEVGNITLNSCVGQFANLLSTSLEVQLPNFLRGNVEAILSNDMFLSTKNVLFMRIEFTTAHHEITGYVVFLMNDEALQALKQCVDQFLAEKLS